MKKKYCVIYGNCQERGFHVCLKRSDAFSKQYDIYLYENYSMMVNKDPLPIDILKQADLCIYQPIADQHGVYASDHVKSYLPEHCKTISFPYIYNSALWPLFPDGGEIIGREAIDDLLAGGLSLRQVLKRFCSRKIDFQFERRFEKTMGILRAKEAVTDIKVADFIVDNLPHEKLFLCHNHPTTTVFVHCVNQVLHILDLPPLTEPEKIHPNEAKLVDCYPLSPYERGFYNLEYIPDWRVFLPEKKHNNWHRFHFRLILKIYLSSPRSKWAQLFWIYYVKIRIYWSLWTNQGYINKRTKKENK